MTPPTSPSLGFLSSWRLGEPDLVPTMPEAFTSRPGKDIFRCFVLPTGLTEDKVVVGVEYRPGAPRVVHHALFFLDASGTARELDQRDDGPGYRTFGGVGFLPTGGLGGYAPGLQPWRTREGTGRLLEKGADVVLQVHYHSSGKAETDQGRIGLHFARAPIKSIISGAAVLTRDIDIPAGEGRYARDASVTLPCDITVVGVAPHMHYLGKAMKVHATTPGGDDVPLIWVKDWDFRWQGQYLYAQPIRLLKGTRIDLHAVYDNSAANPRNPSDPPRQARRTATDEMCICFPGHHRQPGGPAAAAADDVPLALPVAGLAAVRSWGNSANLAGKRENQIGLLGTVCWPRRENAATEPVDSRAGSTEHRSDRPRCTARGGCRPPGRRSSMTRHRRAKHSMQLSRRGFLRRRPGGRRGRDRPRYISAAPASRRRARSSTSRASIGGMGASNLRACAGGNIVALCDVDEAYAGKTFKKYPQARVHRDFRKIERRTSRR